MYLSALSIIPEPTAPQAPNLYNANNQLPSSMASYDAAGNQNSYGGNNLTYDAENRQISLSGVGVNETYAYDGDGKRVEKLAGSALGTVFVYDALGRMAAEYSAAVDTPNCITCYLSPDHLGNARMITNQNGNVVSRHDYLPFGGEIAANQAGRNSQWGSGNDDINQKFTGKERDSESGLDYFGARYYGSALGRFTSPDRGPYKPSDPQTWNRYEYVRNNPLAFTDPSGSYFVISTADRQLVSFLSTLLSSGAGRNLVSSIANDPRPVHVSSGRLPIRITGRGSAIQNGLTAPQGGKPGSGGGVNVTVDPVNLILTGALSGEDIHALGLRAFTHELFHVLDILQAPTFQAADIGGMAGDAPIAPGGDDTVGGTAEARATALISGLSLDDGTDYVGEAEWLSQGIGPAYMAPDARASRPQVGPDPFRSPNDWNHQMDCAREPTFCGGRKP